MTAADLVAILRALSVIPIAWLIVVGSREAALVIFVLAALSDAADGWLARRAGNLSPRGEFIDPIADKILVLGTLITLSVVGSGWPVTVVTIGLLLREGLVAILRARALTQGIRLPADRVGKLKTVVEMAGAALIILDGRPWAVLGAGLVGIALLLGIVALPRYLAVRTA